MEELSSEYGSVDTDIAHIPAIPEPSLLPVNETEALQFRQQYERDLDSSRLIEEQTLAYHYWLDSLDRQVEKGLLTTQQRNRIISSLIVSKDLQLEEQYSDARTDRLTRLPNRLAFEETIAKVIAEQEPFAVITGDLDKFKSINDTHGHGAGDLVLMQAALRLRGVVRQPQIAMPHSVHHPRSEETSDIIARVGGEEYAVLLRGITDPEQLRIAAERIRESFESTPFPITDNNGQQHELYVTTSIGASVFHHDSIQSLLAENDSKLYQAKENGRNQVVI